MKANRYLFQLLVCLLLVSALAAGINFFVDPYGVNNARRIDGFNAFKVDINAHARLLKKYQPAFNEYNALILGNSRVEMGLDPAHQCFTRAGMQVYNLGVPGAGLARQLAYAMNVIHEQPVEHVLLSVDFIDYLSTSQSRVTERPIYMRDGEGSLKYFPSGEVNEAFASVKLKDYFRALFSLDALISSVKTVALQGRAATDRDERGFNPGLDFASMVKVEGAHALFDQKLGDLRGKYGRPRYFRDAHGQTSNVMRDLEAFLDFATARGMAVTVFVNPLHQAFWQLMESNGHMPLYEDWLQETRKLLEKYADSGVAFWDFSQPSAYNSEPVPTAGGEAGALQWFWEPSHYRRELGDLMIEAMLADRCATQAVFGERLQ